MERLRIALAVGVSSWLVACAPYQQTRPSPDAPQSEAEIAKARQAESEAMKASVDAHINFLDCTNGYARSHARAQATATEVSDAAVAACSATAQSLQDSYRMVVARSAVMTLLQYNTGPDFSQREAMVEQYMQQAKATARGQALEIVVSARNSPTAK